MKRTRYISNADLDRKLNQLRTQGAHIMATLKQVQDEVATLVTKVKALTDVDAAAITLLNGLTAMIASLKQQLADAIAGGADPAALQAILDEMGSLESTVDAKSQELAAAITANTPAA